jgi:hypothetical protein
MKVEHHPSMAPDDLPAFMAELAEVDDIAARAITIPDPPASVKGGREELARASRPESMNISPPITHASQPPRCNRHRPRVSRRRVPGPS